MYKAMFNRPMWPFVYCAMFAALVMCIYLFYLNSSAESSLCSAIDLIQEIDLGERDFGEKVVQSVILKNKGTAVLIIDDQKSSCSCTGLVVKENGVMVVPEKLTVGPHSEIQLFIQVVVNGDAGERRRHTVDVRTNDPQFPRKQIQVVIAKVKKGAYIQPLSYSFGNVVRGSKERKVFEVRDSRDYNRNVVNVISHDSRVAAKINQIEKNQIPSTTNNERTGKLLAFVEVSIDTRIPGEIDTRLQLQFSDQHGVELPVHGVVLQPVIARPSVLLLPKSSSNGLIRESFLMLTCNTSGPFTVTNVDKPEYVQVTIDGSAECTKSKNVTVKLIDDYHATGNLESEIKLDCVLTGSSETFPVRVKLIVHSRR